MPEYEIEPEFIELTTWHLEMLKPPVRTAKQPRPDGLEIVRVANTPVHFYRYLYNKIGEPWVWWERKRQTDDEISADLHDPGFEFFVPYLHGAPVGMLELNGRNPKDIQLNYFGIVPEFCGRGIGRYALEWSVDYVWSKKPDRYWVHTCSLDSPAALPTYRNAGFVLFDTITEKVRNPVLSPTV